MRFGLFGTGPWAHQTHAPALAAHAEVEFTGVWGRNAAKAAALADEYGTTAYPTVEALIEDVDAVAVALPPDVQAPIALAAARAGKHLLLDKPVAFTNEESAEIVDAVAARDLSSVVFFTRRFNPAMREFLAGAAETGGWREGRVDHLGSIFHPGNDFGKSAWRRDQGGLWDVGPHAVALVRPLLGPVTEVTGLAGPDDMTHLLLRHETGAISRLVLSVDAPQAAAREEASFSGTAGVLPVPEMRWSPVEAFGRALDELVAGQGSECDVRFGAEITAVLVAAAASITSGRAVKIG